MYCFLGNLTGFLSVIAYTYLLTLVPFYLGYALTTAFGQIFVQVLGAKWFFKEEISLSQWFGIILIIVGTLFLVKNKMKNILRFLIIKFDQLLSNFLGVKIFTDNSSCILRYRIIKNKRYISLPNDTISKGEFIVELHLWNEHIPIVPEEGVSLFWGENFKNLFFYSFGELIDFLEKTPYKEVDWFFGEICFFYKDHKKVVRFLKRLGFIVYPVEASSIFQKFYIFLQNIYSFFLIYAYNPNSLRGKNLFSGKRYHLWIKKDIIKSVLKN